jgi:hypothetical protein
VPDAVTPVYDAEAMPMFPPTPRAAVPMHHCIHGKVGLSSPRRAAPLLLRSHGCGLCVLVHVVRACAWARWCGFPFVRVLDVRAPVCWCVCVCLRPPPVTVSVSCLCPCICMWCLSACVVCSWLRACIGILLSKSVTTLSAILRWRRSAELLPPAV